MLLLSQKLSNLLEISVSEVVFSLDDLVDFVNVGLIVLPELKLKLLDFFL